MDTSTHGDPSSIAPGNCYGLEWLLLVSPAVEGDVLVIGGDNPVGPLNLKGMFGHVEIWHQSQAIVDRHKRYLNAHGCDVAVRHVEIARVDTELANRPRRWELVAILDSSPGFGRHIPAIIKSAQKYLTASGQCCLVISDRDSLARLKHEGLRALQHPSSRQITRVLRMTGFGTQQVLHPHPDHSRPSCLLGWEDEAEYVQRGRPARLMQALGLERFTHDSALIVGSRTPKRSALRQLIESESPLAGSPQIQRFLIRGDGTIVCIYRRSDTTTGRVIKVAMTEHARGRLAKAWTSAANTAVEHPWLRPIIPHPISNGILFNLPYYIEEQCDGITAREFATHDSKRLLIVEHARQFLSTIGLRTSRPRKGDQLVRALEAYFAPIKSYRPRYAAPVEELSRRVAAELGCETLPFVLLHGDFNPGNVFCKHDSGEICGVIDWDASEPAGPAMLDLFSFLFGMNPALRRHQIGTRLALALGDAAWNAEEEMHIGEYMKALDMDPSIRNVLLIIYWAKHVSTHLQYRTGPLDAQWERRNLTEPLKHILESVPR